MNLDEIKTHSDFLDYCDLQLCKHKTKKGYSCGGCELKKICFSLHGNKNAADYILEKIFQKVRKQKLGKLLGK